MTKLKCISDIDIGTFTYGKIYDCSVTGVYCKVKSDTNRWTWVKSTRFKVCDKNELETYEIY